MKKDKNILGTIITIVILTFIVSITLPNKVTLAANEAEIKFSINGGTGGEVKAGSNIEIAVDLNKLVNFYAGSVDYTYDNTLLEVSSIDIDPKFKQYYEAYNDTAKNGNIARYGFTMFGDEKGINGSTRFITIKGKAKKDGNLTIKPEDVESVLVQNVDGTIKEFGNTIFSNGKENYLVTDEKSTDGTAPKKKVELIPSNDNKPEDTSSEVSNSGNSSGEPKLDKAQENINNPENKSETVEVSDSLEKSFDETTSENEDINDSENISNDEKNNNSNTYIYLSLTLGFIAIVAVGIFMYKKRKNRVKSL